MKRFLCAAAVLGMLAVSVVYNARMSMNVSEVLSRNTNNEERMTIVIDPGHGGNDPGGIGAGGVLEKDVNLAVAKFLRDDLAQQGFEVVMTRETDQALYSEGAKNKKKDDLAKRIALIENTSPDFVICIHQNIFTDPKYSGAQVFYHQASAEGAEMAACIQNQLIAGIDPQNTRAPKSNMEYYMLKKSPKTIVIVECGFLSNAEEETKLGTVDYQRKLAWNIYMGMMHYLNGAGNSAKG